MNQSLDQILTPESQSVSIGYVQRLYTAFAAGLPLPDFRGELEYYRKDGSTLWTECLTYPVVGSDGNSLTMLGVTRDITERKEAEVALRKSEENFKAIANYAAGWEAWFDPSGKLIWMNPFSVEMTGYTPEEYLASADFLSMFCAPEDMALIIKKFKEALNGSSGTNLEVRVLHKDGSKFWVSISWRPILDANGKSIGFRTSTQNISERKRLEEEKQISDSKIMMLSLAIEQSPVSTVITDLAGNIEFVNPKFTQTTGYTVEEVIGHNPRILKTDYKPGSEYKQMWDMLLSGQTWNGLFQNKKKNGELYWESAVISPVRDKEGTINHFLAVKEDITERIKMEEVLRESEKRYRLLIETASEGIFVAQDSKFKFVNPVLLKLLDYDKYDDIMRVPFLEFVHPEDKEFVRNNYLKRIKGESVESRYDLRIQIKDGSTRWIRLNAVLIDWEGQPATLNLISDITEGKKAELQIKDKNEELQKLNLERDKFFSIIAHDLRGPIGGFMGLTEMMADDYQNFTEAEIREMISNLSQSARNTFNLLENLLEWSQMDHGKTAFNPQNIDLNQVITDCINLAGEQSRAKNLNITFQNHPGQEVYADRNMVQSVIRNLLSNAIKFTPDGGKITISSHSAENNMTVISVKDSGIGMTDLILNNLFHLDAHTKRPGTKGEKSTGLGLQLCKEFVEIQGGKIWVESKPNNGSVFYFTIPRAGKPESISIIEPDILKEHNRNQLKKLKILIAEDDEISAKLMSVMVKGLSQKVFNVKTGDDAVEMCRNHPDIDLVLMDIAMPSTNGLEATRLIRQFNKNIIIIVQTTFSQIVDKEDARIAGCNDYIEKPFSKELLTEMIKKHLSS